MNFRIVTLSALLLLSQGCSFGGEGMKSALSVEGTRDTGSNGGPVYSPTNLTEALLSASRILVQRNPTAEEYTLAAQGVQQYEQVIRQYLDDPVFINSTMKEYFNDLFEMRGAGNNVNFEEPTNLARFIINSSRAVGPVPSPNSDYRNILKAKECYSNTLAPVPCTSFAGNPGEQQTRGAGVVTTQGFLRSWVGPHNFRRVRKVFNVFACSDYPDGSDPGMTADEVADVASGSTANFNTTVPGAGGLVCYSCHNNLNARATFFLNFNTQGVYVPSQTTGVFPGNLPTNTTPTEVAGRNSQIRDLLKATNGVYPIPRYKGQPVNSLAEWTTNLADSDQFQSCMARRFYNFMLGRPRDEALPGQVRYLEQMVPGKRYDVKELLVEVAKSMPFVNR